jgi:hypothetical protein
MRPLRIGQMRLVRASSTESEWLRDRLARASRGFGSRFELTHDDVLTLAISD